MLKKHRRLPDLALELSLRHAGYQIIAGLDEAGRGAWAGPVTAAAVTLPLLQPGLASRLHGLQDSKLLRREEREMWYEQLHLVGAGIAVGHASSDEIDHLGIVPATRLAMRRALAKLLSRPNHLLLDYILLPSIQVPQLALAHGDGRALSIAAASVIAKVERDRMLTRWHKDYPHYGFERHKGYGTRQHQKALACYGPCPLHRLSFAPVAACQERHQT